MSKIIMIAILTVGSVLLILHQGTALNNNGNTGTDPIPPTQGSTPDNSNHVNNQSPTPEIRSRRRRRRRAMRPRNSGVDKNPPTSINRPARSRGAVNKNGVDNSPPTNSNNRNRR